ncbi:MAG: VOC family protein [Pseudomonadales bacterium]
MSFAKDYGVGGYREAVLHVDKFDQLENVMTNVLQYSVRYRGQSSDGQAAFWEAPEASSIDEVLVGPEDVDFGLVRIVRMNGVENQPIRPAGKPWEAGGIYDLDIRVRDVQKVYDQLEDAGWTGIHTPFQYTMGTATVKHCELFGPDRIVLALIERVDPPLGPDAGFDQISNAFNSTQLLYEDELEEHHRFYQDVLGFECLVETEIHWAAPGENVFGLPYSVAMESPAPVYIYHPTGQMAGSLETCAIRGLTGEHYGKFASPRNRGTTTLRFPVKDIEGYAAKIQQQGHSLTQPMTSLTIAPYGETRVFAVKTGAGTWLEFFEEK